MVAYDSMSRAELIETIGSLESRLASAASGASSPSGGAARFPEFGEQERREFEKSLSPIRIFDRETLKYVAVNDAALKLYGYTREEFLGLSTLDTRHPEEHADHYDTLAEHTGYLRHKGPRRHLKKSGEIIVVELVMQDILFNGRNARLSFTLDVTERTRAQDTLRRREQELSALVENAPDIIARFDRDLRHVYVNPAVAAATGLARRACMGKTQRELGMPEHLVAFWEQEIRRVFDSGEGRSIEFECPCHGGLRYFEVRMVPEIGPDGAIETVLTVARDITERKRAETALRESEERFRQLAENIREVFWISSLSGDEVIYVSPAYEELWGESRASLYRDSRSWINAVHPEDRQTVTAYMRKITDGKRPAVEYRIVRPDGSLRWIKDRCYSMTRGDGTPLVCGVAEDITESKRAQEKRIADVMRQRDALVREVHHRIKNHLQGIAGLLRQKANGNPAVATLVETAVAQLHSVATIFGIQSEATACGVSLPRVLAAICSSVESLGGGRIERAFATDAARALRLAETEAVPVAVALNELVLNALKHHAMDDGEASVEVALVEQAECAEIRIVNRGKLPAGFDYVRDRGTGTGLDLVRTLLASKGSTLSFYQRGDKVETMLKLSAPVVGAAPAVPLERVA